MATQGTLPLEGLQAASAPDAAAGALADSAAALADERCSGCGRDCRLAAPLCTLGRDLARERLAEMAAVVDAGSPADNARLREEGWRERFADDAAHRRQSGFCG